MSASFAPGTAVRVRDDWPEAQGPVHIRTPHYLRGRAGTVVRYLGEFPNPEDLAFSRPAARLALYHVVFQVDAIWPDDPIAADLLVEVFEPWLLPI
jgi:hypothetical protein